MPVGAIVTIPFRRRTELGVVVAHEPAPHSVHSIHDVLDVYHYAALSPTQRTLAALLQRFYGATETQAYTTVLGSLPRTKNAPRRLPSLRWRPSGKTPFSPAASVTQLLTPSLISLKSLTDHIRATATPHSPALLLFPDSVSAARAQALVNAPNVLVASEQSARDDRASWDAITEHRVVAIIGTRRALFTPIDTPSSIILWDAASDLYRSWDQEPHYDTRELALALTPNVLILVGPSPVLFAPDPGTLVRVAPDTSPALTVHGYQERLAAGPKALFSTRTVDAMKGPGRALVFVNRLGNGVDICASCGYVRRCASCQQLIGSSDSLTRCTRCAEAAHPECARCQAIHWKTSGVGIDRVERGLRDLLKERPILRWDARLSKKRQATDRLLHAIEQHKNACILATSSILTRLWLLPRIETVIVLRPETWSSQSSWRGSEEFYWVMLSLVRAAKREVHVETNDETYPPLALSLSGDYRSMITREQETRSRFHYPPFQKLLVLKDKKPGATLDERATFARRAGEVVSHTAACTIVRTPPSADIARLCAGLPANVSLDINPPHLP